MITKAQMIAVNTQIRQKAHTVILIILVPFHIRSRLTEELQLHLFKFSGTENKVSRCNFITEALTDLSDTKWQLLTHGALYVFKIDKHPLCRFRAQIDSTLRILYDTLKGFKHQIKLTDIRKIMRSAFWTFQLMLFNIIHHCFIAPALNANLTVCSVLNQLIGTKSGFTLLAVHQWIGESADMTAGNPYCRIHQDRRLYTCIIWRFLNEFTPPGFFYIFLQFDSQRTEIPRIGQTAVDFRSLKHKTTVFRMGYYSIK